MQPPDLRDLPVAEALRKSPGRVALILLNALVVGVWRGVRLVPFVLLALIVVDHFEHGALLRWWLEHFSTMSR